MSRPLHIKPRKKKKSKIILLITSLCVLMIVAAGILYGFYYHQASTLQHTWQSEETGIILTFTKEGKVTFKSNLPSGTYHIVSPSTLEYTIDGKTFLMIYRFKDEKLYWGIDENSLECFRRHY